jgi:hypothetical protein
MAPGVKMLRLLWLKEFSSVHLNATMIITETLQSSGPSTPAVYVLQASCEAFLRRCTFSFEPTGPQLCLTQQHGGMQVMRRFQLRSDGGFALLSCGEAGRSFNSLTDVLRAFLSDMP